MNNIKRSKKISYIFISLLLLITGQTGFAQGTLTFAEIFPPYITISPIAAKLQNLSSDSLSGELNKLQAKIESEGLPLLERDPFCDNYLYMTLVYRTDAKNKKVDFEVFGIYDEYRFGDRKMYRLKDSDLFYRCYMVPNDICFSYRFKITDTATGKSIYDIDKYNKNRIPTGAAQDFSYSVLDLRQNEPDWNRKRYADTGSKVDTVVINSKILNNSRDIFIYLPPGYSQKHKPKYPVIYLFDSFVYLNRVEVPNILDNLIREGRIEPMIAVMIDNVAGKRNIELPLNFDFKQFIVDELIPFIRKEYNTSPNPAENIIGGMSYGGETAMFVAFYHPDIFGKVLSQSGSLWRDLDVRDDHSNEIRGDWLINQFIVEKNRGLKIFLDWGLQENWCLQAGRRMARVLDSKGYDYRFVEFNGWHDWSNSRKTFPAGLMYLLEN